MSIGQYKPCFMAFKRGHKAGCVRKRGRSEGLGSGEYNQNRVYKILKEQQTMKWGKMGCLWKKKYLCVYLSPQKWILTLKQTISK